MDIKDCIKLCTKINKNQGMSNVKWSKIPKANNQYHKKPLPHHLEMEQSLHDTNKKHGKSKKREKKDQKKDENFQVAEIRQGIQEVGIGWNAINAIEKRYKESQKKYAAATMDKSSSESNDSFVTAQNSTTTETDDSFLSTKDFDLLKISESDKNIQSEVLCRGNEKKEQYKRNAFIKGIIQNKENISPLASANSIKTDTFNKVVGDEKKSDRNENRQSIHENKVLKYVQSEAGTSKTYKTSKKFIKRDSKQENDLVPKGAKVAETSTENFMEVSNDCFRFVTTKSMKNSKKTKKRGGHEF